jgi:hypothetical protein
MGSWLEALPAVAVAVLLLIIPGLIIRLAGWGAGNLGIFFFVPAISLAVLAVASNAAHIVGARWGLLPVGVVTILGAGVAFLVRMRSGAGRRLCSLGSVVAAIAGLIGAAIAISLQLMYVFVGPDSISQTFDNIVHLNSIRLALDTADASAVQIGATSDIGFYPNAWHSVVTLVAQVTDTTVPWAVNTTNIAIGAVVWPVSAMALAWAYFGDRASALGAAAALSTGFGAFPILLVYFGVLYPNFTGYAVLPAGIAAVIVLLRSIALGSAANVLRSALLLVVACAAVGLGHPNAFLALYAIGSVAVVVSVLRRAAHRRSARAYAVGAGIAAVLSMAGLALWRFADTPYEMSRWGPWQTAAQAAGEALLVAPRQYPITLVTAALILIGLIVVARRPVRVEIAAPFAVGAFLFVLVSGIAVGNPVRELFTRPWYNDPYRLAALLPIVALPLGVLAVLAIVRIARTLLSGAPNRVIAVVSTAIVAAVFSAAVGPNVLRTAEDARAAYTSSPDARLLSTQERALIERLPETTPADAVIAGSPSTGVALAYALTGRDVLERHIFGSRTPDEQYIDENLAEIARDPAVCAAVREAGVTHVLDFGDVGVVSDPAIVEQHEGVQDLPDTVGLQLLDEEGPDARLFAVTC